MSVIVTDTGFAPDDWTGGFVAMEALAESPAAGLELAPEADPEALRGRLEGVGAIRVVFPVFADGRGFSLARRLRGMGYAERLRAAGHLIADQYAMARRAGFDEVELDEALAARQPEAQWLARAGWRAHDYQARLGRRTPEVRARG